ncbi:MAG: hypothetical protein M3R61_07025 [Chloroflexota bacterium]|nr:hypothetical protein [Chloroflexota bacterium]
MPTVATPSNLTRGPLPPYGTAWDSYGLSGQSIADEIRRIREREVHTLLRKSPDLPNIAVDILELTRSEPEDLRPSTYSVMTILPLLINAGIQAHKSVPYGAPSTDDERGSRIEWHWRGRDLRLVVPASAEGRHYIYHELDDDYGLEMRVDATTLAKWLDWLTNV